MKWRKWFGIVLAVAVVSCGPSLVAKRMTTTIDGLPVDLGSLGGGCGSIGVGTRPTQADIDLCKANLSKPDGDTLQILWEVFKEVVTDGVHNGETCPILVLYPLQNGHTDGSISDADFAKRMLKFYKAKYKQNLSGDQDKAKARLIAAGLPLP